MFITLYPAAVMLSSLNQTSPIGQAPHMAFIPSQAKPVSHFTAATEPGMGASWPHPPSHILSNVGYQGVPSRTMSHPDLERGSRGSPGQPHQRSSAVPWLWPGLPHDKTAYQHGTSLPNTTSVLVSRAEAQNLPQDPSGAVATGSCTAGYQPKRGTPNLPSKLLQAGGRGRV